MLKLESGVAAKYPTTTFGILRMRSIGSQDPPPEFRRRQDELEAAVRERFTGMDKKEMRLLRPFSDYHSYYRNFKKTYHVLHQCESIASGRRSLPGGPPLVQAMFMAEIGNRLLTAGYDCSDLRGPFTVRLAGGNTRFLGMGERVCTVPENDILFAMGQTVLGSIICGPDHEHRIRSATTDVLFAVYGVPGISAGEVRRHLEDIGSLVQILDPGAKIDGLSIVSAAT